MEAFFKRWIIVGISIAFVVFAVKRIGDGSEEER